MRLDFPYRMYCSETVFTKMMSCMNAASAICKQRGSAFKQFVIAKRNMKCSRELQNRFYTCLFLLLLPIDINNFKVNLIILYSLSYFFFFRIFYLVLAALFL